MMNTAMVVVPVGDASWADVEQIFGTRGDPARCWCQWFRLPSPAYAATSSDERCERMREQTVRHPSPGMLAYLDGEPVGWCAIAPRTEYPLLERSPIARAASKCRGSGDDDLGLWSVTCFVVRVGFRRRGVAAALLRAAVDYAHANGAQTIEGFPVDPSARQSMSAADMYHGTISLFHGAGFDVVARPSASRAVMRLTTPT